MHALSGLDGAFLHLESEATPMHVASLHLFDLPASFKGDFYGAVRRMMARKMHLAPVFQRRLAPMPLQFANPVWVRDRAPDLDYHIRRVRLPEPGTQAQLEACTAALHAQLLDRTRPLWQLTVIEGLESGQIGYYIKIHHAVLDGAAGVALATTLFDLEPQPRALPRRRAADAAPETPGALRLAGAAFRHDGAQIVKLLRHLPEVARTLAGMVGALGAGSSLRSNLHFGPRTVLNGPVTGVRSFAAVSLPLAEVKAIAAAREATVNDVVLTLCGGALRAFLSRHGGIPRKSLTAAMPISLRQAGNRDFTTQATLSLVDLATHIADPLRRLAAVARAAGAIKAVARGARSVIPTDFPTIGAPWLLGGLAALYGRSRLAGVIPPIANVVISNVPGPPVPLYVAGATMSAYWPLSIVEHGVGLNITVMSYAGALGFGFTAAASAVPEARPLAEALAAAHADLLARALPAPKAAARRRAAGATPADARRVTPAPAARRAGAAKRPTTRAKSR